MSKTNELRALVKEMLIAACPNVSYEMAIKENIYPHIVFLFQDVDTTDLNRDDISMYIDIWDKSRSASEIEELTDAVERIFENKNTPQDNILPTFYVGTRTPVPDEDKQLRHRLLVVNIQNYGRKV